MQSPLINYLQIFFRRRYFFLYPFVLSVFVMVVASFVLPKSYVATSVVLIEEENVINPLISGLAVSTSVADRLRILREQILSWKSLAELTRRLKLDEEVKSQFAYESLIKRLRRDIIVELRGPQLVSISYEGRDPKKVQLVAQTLTDIFIQQNQKAQSRETDVAVNFLEDQLKFYRYKIKEDDIKRLQVQLDELLVDSTPKHPLVKNLQDKITKLKIALDNNDVDISSQTTKVTDNVSFLILKELQKKSDDEAAFPENLGLNKEDILMTKRISEGLPIDTSVNQNIYSMLLKRLETARITKQLDSFKEGTRFTVLDPPRLPLKPIKPDPVTFLLLGIALGCAIGYGCIFIVEMVDQSFRNINDAKAGLELPILGSIAAIVTEKEFNKQHKMAKFSYIIIAAFFGLLVSIVILYSMFS